MAKCIKYPSGVVARVSDDKATEIVASGAAKYTSKGQWKQFIGFEARMAAAQALQENAMVNAKALAIARSLRPKKQRKVRVHAAFQQSGLPFRGAVRRAS